MRFTPGAQDTCCKIFYRKQCCSICFDYRLALSTISAAVDDSLTPTVSYLIKDTGQKITHCRGFGRGDLLCNTPCNKGKRVPLPFKGLFFLHGQTLHSQEVLIINVKTCLSPHGSAQNCSRFYAGIMN
jgi:hypothetical protein